MTQRSLATIGDDERFLGDICPFCGSEASDVVRRGPDIIFGGAQEFRALACHECGGWYTQGSVFRSLGDYYEHAYPAGYYAVASGGRDGDPGSNPLVRDVLARFVPASRATRVLDVGCGNGGFTNVLRAAGFDASGLEINATAAEYARQKYGLSVFVGRIEELPEAQFDAITLVGTIEHFLNPVKSVTAIRRHLRSGGLLVFDYPIIDCLESRLASARWWGLDLPRHTVHFTDRHVARTLEAAHFRVVRIVPVRTTWFHYGFVRPPSAIGVPRTSLVGLGYQAIAATLLMLRRSPLHVCVAERME